MIPTFQNHFALMINLTYRMALSLQLSTSTQPLTASLNARRMMLASSSCSPTGQEIVTSSRQHLHNHRIQKLFLAQKFATPIVVSQQATESPISKMCCISNNKVCNGIIYTQTNCPEWIDVRNGEKLLINFCQLTRSRKLRIV